MTLQRIDHGPSEVSADSIQDMTERFAMAVKQRELISDYIKQRLTTKHFYKVPGSDKPSLNKDGAEVIAMPFGLKARYVQTGGPTDPPPDDTPYQITVKCELFSPRGDAGEGLGSASSHITRRRDHARIPRQPDIGLRHNATLKMAQKSAYISAILASTAASEWFTQDMEDAASDGDSDKPQERTRPATPPVRRESTPAPSNDDLFPGLGDEEKCPLHHIPWVRSKDQTDWLHRNGEQDGRPIWCVRSKLQTAEA